MVESLKQKWRCMSVVGRWSFLVILGLVMSTAFSLLLVAADTDIDGLPDEWEMQYFGDLDETGSGDPDSDGLTNLQEYQAGTDPEQSDTDRDNWSDSIDSNALSRAYMDFGNAAFTTNDIYQYAGPVWWLGAVKYGGNWQTGAPTAWHVEASETNFVSLDIDVERSELTNDMVLRLMLFDHTNGSLFVDLQDANSVALETNLFGNIMEGTDTNVTIFLDIPFQTYTNASVINLRRNSGEITLYDALAYVDLDGDGLDSDQENQLGSSDQLSDSDADGLSDYAEVFTHNTDPTVSDSDGDGLSDGSEVNTYGSDPNDVDSDNDGIKDGDEVYYGDDPAVSNVYSTIPFTELFETNTVVVGGINGQNNWSAIPTNTAIVQHYVVHDGNQALEFDPATDSEIMAQHLFAAGGHNVVWLDMQIRSMSTTAPTGQVSDAAVLFFNDEGYLVVYDGLQSSGNEWITLTNQSPVSEDEWVQLTLKLDYSSQKWAICLNGRVVAVDLGFASQRNDFTSLAFEGGEGFVDNVNVKTTPSPTMDFDEDGLSNEEESSLGTDVLNPDSDNDGMNDGTEVEQGFSPTSSNQFFRIDAGSGTNTLVVSFESSEGYTTNTLNGQNSWVASNGVTVVNTENNTTGGVQSVKLVSRGATNGPTEDMLMNIGASAIEEAWITLYMKWPQGKPELEGSPVAGDIYISRNRVYAYDGALQNWVISTKKFFVDSDEWTRIDFGMDYVNGKYLVCIDGVLAVDMVGFGDSDITTLSQVEVRGDSSDADSECYVDDIRISSEEPAADFDFDNDGLSNAEEYQAGSDIRLVDTDGDTISDYDEVHIHGTDPAKADTDSDGIPDNWEIDNGLDPNDDSDASLDPDNDGLTNLEEYQNGSDINDSDTDDDGLSDSVEVNTHGTDPTMADTDNDGMPDKWEVDNGTNPLVDDAFDDPDGDGLRNLTEYDVGTDPLDADTDDDGISDLVEVMASADPLSIDFDGNVTDINFVNGSDVDSSIGTWATEGSVVYARERNGYVEYTINIPSNDYYALAVEVTQHNPLTVQSEFDLSLYIDGVYSGRQITEAPYGTDTTATYFLPLLTATSHTAKIVWKNTSANTFLQINSLTLQSYGGTDSNSNGVRDWIESRLANISDMNIPSETSLVSPICLEGVSAYQDILDITVSYAPEDQTQQVVVVKHGIDDNWYADLLLSPTNDTIINVSDQDGAATYTNTVTWVALNALDGIYTNSLMIRNDSSLLLTAYPTNATNGTITIDVYTGENLLTNVMTTIDEPFEYLFDSAGEYSVIGSFSNDTSIISGTVTVEVVSGSFNGDPACVAGIARTWLCPNIPDEAVVEYDDELTVSSSLLEGGGLNFTLATSYDISQHFVARLGQDGPVLDNAKVTCVWGDNGSYWKIVETNIDGSRLVEVSLCLGNIPSDLVVVLSISVGGVTFEDGTLTKTLTASDFNDMGVAIYRFIQGAEVTSSVCHTTSIYQGTEKIN